MQTITHILYFN